MDGKRISVIVATHDGERFLSQQIDSLLSQTRLPDEIIVSDDDSQDDTLDIIRSFEPPPETRLIVSINRPPLGFGDNFIKACDLATGDLIAFCDQDDIWYPRKLEVCSGFFVDRSVTLVAHACDLINEMNDKIGSFNQGIVQTGHCEVMSKDLWGTYWGMSLVFRRKILRTADPGKRFVDYIQPDRLIAHDRWACFLAQVLGRIVEVEEPLAGYRQHGSNLFGASGHGASAELSDIIRSNLVYRDATARMLAIIEEMDPQLELEFPAFNREKALETSAKALEFLEARNGLYREKYLLKRTWVLMKNLTAGKYTNHCNDKIRIRSFLKDAMISATPRGSWIF